jgi:phage repressor protein C with HTH and peptisase S24 domain
MTEKERIEELLHYFRMEQKEFAEKCGFRPQILSDIKFGKCSISRKIVEKILTAFPEISREWLLIGEGEKLKGNTEQGNTAVKSLENRNEGIPLIHANAFAGGFTGNVQVLEYECERYVVPMFKGADFLIPIKGSSMYPKYSSGDVVACKKLTSWSFFQWGKVYVLYTEQGVIIKRIREGKDEEHVLVISDNAERYEPFQLHRSEILDVAIVVGVMRLE